MLVSIQTIKIYRFYLVNICTLKIAEGGGVDPAGGLYTMPYLARSLSSMSPNASQGQTTVMSVPRPSIPGMSSPKLENREAFSFVNRIRNSVGTVGSGERCRPSPQREALTPSGLVWEPCS